MSKRLTINYDSSFIRMAIYSIFLFSGPIKPLLYYYEFPFDITLLTGSLIVIDLILNSIKVKISNKESIVLASVILFYLWMVFSILYSNSTYYSYKKSFLFILNIIALSYPILSKSRLDSSLIIKYISYTSIFLSIWFISMKSLRYSNYSFLVNETFDSIRNTYLGFGLLSGISLIYFFYNRKYILFSISTILILMLGSRGALLFSFLSISLLMINRIINFNLKINYRYIYILFISIFLLAYHSDKLIHLLENSSINRFSTIFTLSSDKSNLGRIEHYLFAIKHTLSSPINFLIGEGIGSYGVISTGEEVMSYPHNILLETWFELGIIGVVLLSIGFIISLFNKSGFLIKMILVLFFFSAMKTQQLSGIRILYGIIGLSLTSNSYLKSKDA